MSNLLDCVGAVTPDTDLVETPELLVDADVESTWTPDPEIDAVELRETLSSALEVDAAFWYVAFWVIDTRLPDVRELLPFV